MVKVSAESLLTIINDILDFSKIEAPQAAAGIGAVRAARRTSATRSKTLARAGAAEGPGTGLPRARRTCRTYCVGDPGRLRQVLVNLIGNAIKFTEQRRGGAEVEVQKPEDGAEAGGRNATSHLRLHFSVRDTGIGIPTDKQRIHLRGVHAGRSFDDAQVRRHRPGADHRRADWRRADGRPHLGGERAGQGQHVSLHGPVRPAAGTARRRRRRPSRHAWTGLPVLVVDDNATNRRILHEVLTNWRMRPTVVDGGRRRWPRCAEAAETGEPYPLVLLDGHMPEMDGFTLAQRIQATPELSGSGARHADLGRTARRRGPLPPAGHPRLPDQAGQAVGAARHDPHDPERRELDAGARGTTPRRSSRPRPLRILVAEDNVDQPEAGRLLCWRSRGTASSSPATAGRPSRRWRANGQGDKETGRQGDRPGIRLLVLPLMSC